MKVGAVIVAAGSGTRMGAGKNKVFLELFGKTILENTVSVFENCAEVDSITVVASDVELVRELLSDYGKVSAVVEGGRTRQESVKNGLLAAECDIALIHDGARALIRDEELCAVISAAEKYGAAAVGVKCKDTLKEASADGFISRTVDRERMYNIQTPQAFLYEDIKELHLLARDNTATDDCALFEAAGKRVKIVDGSYDNIKITTPDDMEIAEKILKRRAGL